MRVYHFTGADYGLEDIERRRLKIATLSDVNDPFELAVCCDDPVRRRALRATRAEWATRFGMLCFAAGWHNPVQWSHYADKHEGVCLGFDVSKDLLRSVSYEENPPELDWHAIELRGEDGEEQMLRWSSTKYVHWVYEDEWRLFLALEERDEAGLYFADFGEHLRLREIIVGAQSKVTRRQVATALGQLPNIDCFSARLAFQGYRVVKQLDESRWR